MRVFISYKKFQRLDKTFSLKKVKIITMAKEIHFWSLKLWENLFFPIWIGATFLKKTILWIWTTVSWGYHVLYYLEFQNGLFVTRHICESQPRHTFLLAFRALPTSEKLKLTVLPSGNLKPPTSSPKFHANKKVANIAVLAKTTRGWFQKWATLYWLVKL